jgi:hypothetical protein
MELAPKRMDFYGKQNVWIVGTIGLKMVGFTIYLWGAQILAKQHL